MSALTTEIPAAECFEEGIALNIKFLVFGTMFLCGHAAGDTISGTIKIGPGAFNPVVYSVVASDGVTLSGSNRLFEDPPYEISVCYTMLAGTDPCQLASPGGINLNHEVVQYAGGIQAFLFFTSVLSSFTPVAGIDNQTFTAPFTATGTMDGVSTESNHGCQLPDATSYCSVPITGFGTETLTVRYSSGYSGASYQISTVSYVFASVPEPSTMLTLFLGLLVFAIASHHRCTDRLKKIELPARRGSLLA